MRITSNRFGHIYDTLCWLTPVGQDIPLPIWMRLRMRDMREQLINMIISQKIKKN